MDIDEEFRIWDGINYILIKTSNFKNIHENDDVYFVHSFMAKCPNDQLIAYTDYGTTKITAIAAKENVIGCQFHPEKVEQ